MGTRLTSSEHKVALFDSVTDRAFGPVFENEEDAQSFLEFSDTHYGDDLRTVSEPELDYRVGRWSQIRLVK